MNKPTWPPSRTRRWPAVLLGIIIGVALVLLWQHAGAEQLQGPSPKLGTSAKSLSYTQTPTPLALKRADTRVIDGDTIVLNGSHVRLFGIDAPELGQLCKDGWPAGEKARGFLRTLILDR